jgi:hypothetical protein
MPSQQQASHLKWTKQDIQRGTQLNNMYSSNNMYGIAEKSPQQQFQDKTTRNAAKTLWARNTHKC